MKKLLFIIVLSLLTQLTALSQEYPHVTKYKNGKTVFIVFEDSEGKAKKTKIRDEMPTDNIDLSDKNSSVPKKLAIGLKDVATDKVDLATAKKMCATATKITPTPRDSWKWRLPTQKEMEAIYSLEGNDADVKSEEMFLRDGKGYLPLKKAKYWVQTVKKGLPTYFDVSQEEGKTGTISQDSTLYVRCVRDFYQVMPKFNGGDISNFHEWVGDNLKYPIVASKKQIKGRVLLKFVVDRHGSVVEIETLEYTDSALIQEAVRVLESSPKWTPGMQNGRNVRVTFTIPIEFRMTRTQPITKSSNWRDRHN